MHIRGCTQIAGAYSLQARGRRAKLKVHPHRITAPKYIFRVGASVRVCVAYTLYVR